jgi:hypothetical protein
MKHACAFLLSMMMVAVPLACHEVRVDTDLEKYIAYKLSVVHGMVEHVQEASIKPEDAKTMLAQALTILTSLEALVENNDISYPTYYLTRITTLQITINSILQEL